MWPLSQLSLLIMSFRLSYQALVSTPVTLCAALLAKPSWAGWGKEVSASAFLLLQQTSKAEKNYLLLTDKSVQWGGCECFAPWTGTVLVRSVSLPVLYTIFVVQTGPCFVFEKGPIICLVFVQCFAQCRLLLKYLPMQPWLAICPCWRAQCGLSLSLS